MLTQERLKEVLHYDPDTGVFTWKKSGKTTGCKMSNGYLSIRVDCKLYLAHRLVWLYMLGFWPKDQIDHIDRKRDNNKFSNLREATKAQNAQNISNVVGYTYDNFSSNWKAQIRVNGKNKHLGRFKTEEEAQAAYVVAKAKYHQFHSTLN